MSDREGTPEDFARMMRGEQPEQSEEPKPEEDTEPTSDEQVIDWFTRTPERQEAERQFLDSLHKPYESDDAA